MCVVLQKRIKSQTKTKHLNSDINNLVHIHNTLKLCEILLKNSLVLLLKYF